MLPFLTQFGQLNIFIAILIICQGPEEVLIQRIWLRRFKAPCHTCTVHQTFSRTLRVSYPMAAWLTSMQQSWRIYQLQWIKQWETTHRALGNFMLANLRQKVWYKRNCTQWYTLLLYIFFLSEIALLAKAQAMQAMISFAIANTNFKKDFEFLFYP